MNIFFNLFRALLTLIMLTYIFIFLGMVFQGVIDIQSMITITDYIYTLGFLLFGGVMTTHLILAIKRLVSREAKQRYISLWNNQKKALIAAVILFLLMYIFRANIRSLILFAGYEIGRFFIQTARIAYLRLFGFDLNTIQFYLFAWVFQFHFIYTAIQLFLGIKKRFLKKKKQN